ncbi:MAG: peptide-methionine (S)-S-oxide reductase MsrA [Verrucomicrobiia bacterium]
MYRSQLGARGMADSPPHDLADAEAEADKARSATFGGGDFWCMQAMFEHVPGVESVTCGYAGGQTENPTFNEVSSGKTGHAEVVQIKFDPTLISYGKLLDAFWYAHDPTKINRQGDNIGTQYRSIILYQNEGQKTIAERSLRMASTRFSDRIMTEIIPLSIFYKAENDQQDYFRKNPKAGYCRSVIQPRLETFEKKLGVN